jgi:transcriptional regulator with XRE-family HTH domain
MITNERQYRVARAQAERFARALNDLGSRDQGPNIDPAMHAMQLEAVGGQLSELRQSIREYEQLKSSAPILDVDAFDQLPSFLIRARIASGLTQAQLAARLDTAEQQVQRWEASEYATASFGRLATIASTLGVRFQGRGLTERQVVDRSAIIARLTDIGLSDRLIHRRFLPSQATREAGEKEPLAASARLATMAGRVFGADPLSILSGHAFPSPTLALQGARFKLPEGFSPSSVTAYAVYARYLATLVARACSPQGTTAPPADAADFRRTVLAQYGDLTFESLVKYIWSLGMPVLPLKDEAAFHAATWRLGSVDVIVLKQATAFPARWSFDLLHEIYHALTRGPDEDSGTIDAVDSLTTSSTDPDERAANEFAGAVLLGDDLDGLARQAVSSAGGSVERLKATIPGVARAHSVEVDVLANYLAYRLAFQNLNWWGAATNLQRRDVQPEMVARDQLLIHCDFSFLDEVDRDMLREALVYE